MEKPEIAGNTITVPSDTRFLPEVDEFVEEFLRRHGVTESLIADIAISVSELVINAVAHGGRTAPGEPVTISIEKSDGRVTISVADRGAGFNPDEIDDPLADENLLKETGRGIFIVRSLMDTVDIEIGQRGTTVTISKAV
ncbi:MAG: ATP-binding protein [Candidatus Zixiibacteriota bacterium]